MFNRSKMSQNSLETPHPYQTEPENNIQDLEPTAPAKKSKTYHIYEEVEHQFQNFKDAQQGTIFFFISL